MALLSKLLGLRIKELRKTRHLTQSQLAEAIGMETTNLCKLENGGQLPKEENIEKIAKILDVSFHELFTFGHMKTKEELQQELINIIITAQEKDIQLYYKLISAVLQRG